MLFELYLYFIVVLPFIYANLSFSLNSYVYIITAICNNNNANVGMSISPFLLMLK